MVLACAVNGFFLWPAFAFTFLGMAWMFVNPARPGERRIIWR